MAERTTPRMTALSPGASPPPLTVPINGLHELADVTQDTREEVESEEDSE
jgi:hypothetical protein